MLISKKWLKEIESRLADLESKSTVQTFYLGTVGLKELANILDHQIAQKGKTASDSKQATKQHTEFVECREFFEQMLSTGRYVDLASRKMWLLMAVNLIVCIAAVSVGLIILWL